MVTFVSFGYGDNTLVISTLLFTKLLTIGRSVKICVRNFYHTIISWKLFRDFFMLIIYAPN